MSDIENTKNNEMSQKDKGTGFKEKFLASHSINNYEYGKKYLQKKISNNLYIFISYQNHLMARLLSYYYKEEIETDSITYSDYFVNNSILINNEVDYDSLNYTSCEINIIKAYNEMIDKLNLFEKFIGELNKPELQKIEEKSEITKNDSKIISSNITKVINYLDEDLRNKVSTYISEEEVEESDENN